MTTVLSSNQLYIQTPGVVGVGISICAWVRLHVPLQMDRLKNKGLFYNLLTYMQDGWTGKTFVMAGWVSHEFST